MGKKQRERKKRKEEQKRPGVAPPNWAMGEVSPEARTIMDALGRGELFRNELELLEIVTNSTILRDEPEFEDFEFDVDEVLRVVNPMIEAKQDELERARRVSEDSYFEVYTELRLHSIDALLTRERRREFLRRYDEMLSRLLASTETDKIKSALVTRSVFDGKQFPWGLAGIVIELFEEARDAVLDRIETVEDIVIESLMKRDPEMTDAELRAILDDPVRMEQLVKELDPSPDRLDELQEIADHILDDFERTLYSGAVPLDLFTEDELEEVARRMNAITSEPNEHDQELTLHRMEAIAHMLQEFIGEVMTKERQATLASDLNRILREWDQAGNDLSIMLGMELGTLDEVEPAENHFIYAALVGQLRRASGALDDEELENAEGEPDSTVIDGTVIDSNGI